jgi:hypothetical protein
MKIDAKGINFIVEEETGGREYYEKVYKSSFIWPKGASGCTAMVGIDIGYYTEEEINKFFKPLTTEEELRRIQRGRGIKGILAKNYLKNLKNITFSWEESLYTFSEHILPKFLRLTERAFPGAGELCPSTQTALVSLVFNRGTAMKGESRREMLNIKKLVGSQDYKQIAKQIRSMKRLWDSSSGLVSRREKEACLVDKCV